jgi:hypothetical protein
MASKTPSNAVRTTNRVYTYYLEGLIFRGRHNYYMTRNEWFLLLRYHFEGRGSVSRPIVYVTHGGGRTDFAVEKGDDIRFNFLAIGCMKFSKKSIIKIAKWCGLNNAWIKQYLN